MHVKRQARRTGFTLIESMISIAIIAILMAVHLSARNGFQWLSREQAYRGALRSARWELERLRHIPFDQLPPRVVTVGADGWIDLKTADLVSNSVHLRALDGSVLPAPHQVDVARGRMRVTGSAPGQRLVADYAFYTPDVGEAHSVPATAPYQITLANCPVARVLDVFVARGEHLDRVPPATWRLSPATGVLQVPASAAGQVVVVDYRGDAVRTAVSGKFLDAMLHPLEGPGPVKLLHVEEQYGDSVGRLRLTMLKVAP